jgi:putative PIN family toxin of toxin-antitoxin system
MRIVIDTNVVVSGIFFGGKPAELLKLVLNHELSTVATQEILDEYQDTIDYLLEKYNGRKLNFSTTPIFSSMEIIKPSIRLKICRDPDDDKFISCAIDGKCLYIVSGDKDLLTLKQYQQIQIVTVAEFFQQFIP